MENKKYYILVLTFSAQLFFFPLFLDYNINAKFLFVAFGISIFFLFYNDIKFISGVPLVPLALVFPLLLLSSLQAYHLPSALASMGLAILLLLFGLICVPSIYPRGLGLGFLKSFLVFIQFLSVLGLYQYFSFVAVGKTTSPLIPYLLPPNKSPRVSGIFGQPNLFALLLVVGLLVLFFMYLLGPKVLQTKSTFYGRLYYLPLASTTLCFFLTNSRAGMLAFLLSMILMFYYFHRNKFFSKESQFRKRIFKQYAVIIGAYIVLLLLNDYVSVMSGKTFADVGISSDARFIFWTASMLIFLDHPLLGVGLDNFKFLLPKYIIPAHDLLGFVGYEALGYTRWSHNEPLQLLCETGLIGVVVVFLVAYFFLKFLKILRNAESYSMRHFFSVLLLVPFVIQTMFSWPLRHPSLLILFFLLLGSWLAQSKITAQHLPGWSSAVLKSMAVLSLVAIVSLGYFEFRMGTFFEKYSTDNLTESFADFQTLADNPYLEHELLLEAMPSYVSMVNRERDKEFGLKILPYAERLADLHGSHWQWFNLALLYLLLDREADSMSAVNQAIHLRPMEQKYWSFQHYLNMVKASEKTGKPLEYFLPVPPGGDAENVKRLFDFDDRIK